MQQQELELKLDSRISEKLFEFIKPGQVVAVGASVLGEQFLFQLIEKVKEKNLNLQIMPTSFGFGNILISNNMKLANLNEQEIDLAIEFVDSADQNFNFIKLDSTSFVRDKMIALSSNELIVVVDEKNFGKLKKNISLEVIDFGIKKTLLQLESLGEPNLRKSRNEPIRTESNNLIIDLRADENFSIEDLEIETKKIPGVLETGLFLHFADRVITSGKNLAIYSRILGEKEKTILK